MNMSLFDAERPKVSREDDEREKKLGAKGWRGGGVAGKGARKGGREGVKEVPGKGCWSEEVLFFFLFAILFLIFLFTFFYFDFFLPFFFSRCV